ncbi:glycosyltransferase [Azoarcus sp. L1K30]|uniref:glycosyltransferase n=1 Tax=Azoarcus sp. L1K30 TaxID=2820277 RepID=UPI001B81449D|nr:glycosyltransferase [Azoarcus sp. L1K30]MBR0567232.1 glycosyltransferase [Azoarcus sp. L1K30]
MRQQEVKADVATVCGGEVAHRGGVSVSVVLFDPDIPALHVTLATLSRAAECAGLSPLPVVLIDNSDVPTPAIADLVALFGQTLHLKLLHGHGNVGYGVGHNLALREVGSPFHLILNPDVSLADDALDEALKFMEAHPECALVAPRATWPDGRIQHLCKRYPSVLSLLLRGFAPAFIRKFFRAHLARYEMRDMDDTAVLWDPPIISGCFMFWRRRCLDRIGGFDPAYFLYFEDFDLSLRARSSGRLARVSDVRIEHQGGHAASKGWRHIALFVRSGLRFFRVHGWRWW